MSARKDLTTALRKLMPRTWQTVDHDRQLDQVKKVAVLISQREIVPAPNAQGSHLVTFRVYIIDPHEDPGAAEDSLDTAVDTVLFALDSVDWVRWTRAQKVIYQDRRAYELTLEAFTERKD